MKNKTEQGIEKSRNAILGKVRRGGPSKEVTFEQKS